MVGIEAHTRRLRLQVIPDADQDSIELFLLSRGSRNSHFITDAAMVYSGIECIWSALKRHLRKLYGCVPTKYLQAILTERPTQPAESLRVSAGLPKGNGCTVLVY